MMKSVDAGEIQRQLQEWGAEHFRDYLWRHTRDPYRVMIAEFMLHRTRADQVVPVYTEFILHYPDVFSLAQANISDVRLVTEHLGLHWRSAHFIEAARYIVRESGGKFPETENGLREIPGVGEYVAGAILTICYGKSHPVIDSNIARFINRFYGLHLTGEIRRKRDVRTIAEDLFSVEDPGRLLFAILDFTAAICRAQVPLHQECPLKEMCRYYLEGVQVRED
ncbi:DNA glycosylase [Methanofollis aquaemaris]|uniref:DNA glycosylase n=1 Tax=Methanofollis aquaemaris TaxID=126734 RepID=A0A8A3S4E4_9EURY|nr:hypothetical protein [Methanofollis aquaemaris]QSZ66932.1 DNA glycosylase [Methanofollis aquaemaris]